MKHLELEEIQIIDPKLNGETTSVHKNTESDIILDFSNAYSIAQFKFLMDNYIISGMKKVNNEFLNELKKKPSGNFNMKKHVSFYNDIWNFEKLNSLDSEMLKLIDDSKTYSITALKTEENLSNIGFADLLFLYNLIVNKDRYGGDRATMFFNQYVLKDGSYAQSFYKFQNEQDKSGKLYEELKEKAKDKDFRNLYEELKEKAKDKDFRNLIYFSLFNKPTRDHNKTAVFVVDNSYEAKESKQMGFDTDKHYDLKNPYFTLLDSIEPNVNTYADLIEKKIKRSKTIIETQCNGL
jgi:hypothetical protein